MNRRLGLAVIGVGMAAKPHALALNDLRDQIDVRGVYARTKHAVSSFCDTHNFPAADDIEALASDPSVDAVLLITPPNVRADLVSLFAGHGKHILSEKPLERTADAAQSIVDTCAKAKPIIPAPYTSKALASPKTSRRDKSIFGGLNPPGQR